MSSTTKMDHSSRAMFKKKTKNFERDLTVSESYEVKRECKNNLYRKLIHGTE